MIVEAINRIIALAEPHFHEQDGREYSSRTLTEIVPPLIKSIDLQTLTGLVDLINMRAPQEASGIVHVLSQTEVWFIDRKVDEWMRRATFLKTEVPSSPGFSFGTFMEPENFIVGLQSLFESGSHYEGSDMNKLLRLVSNLSTEAVVTASDDGVSQQVATRQGVVMKATEKVDPRVRLAPYRTFREISQPSSEFVLRLRSRQGQTPMCALYEADGGEWKNQAVLAIKSWLESKLPAAKIVA
jgi:hypothetical protein